MAKPGCGDQQAQRYCQSDCEKGEDEPSATPTFYSGAAKYTVLQIGQGEPEIQTFFFVYRWA
jgi:hypothetical protein